MYRYELKSRHEPTVSEMHGIRDALEEMKQAYMEAAPEELEFEI